MKLLEDYSLKKHNSFGLDAKAQALVMFDSIEELAQRCTTIKKSLLLGGGSNILILNDLDYEVWTYNVKGRSLLSEEEEYVLVEIQSGENWHETVLWAIEQGYGGIENLALIPGNCGAAPIQNIGAYGVEIKDVLHCVYGIQRDSGLPMSFYKAECNFGYRDSIFKKELKGKFIITSIVLKLTKPGYHRLNTSYGAISSTLEQRGITDPNCRDVAQAVIDIRKSKLPDTKVIGNAGSFFKNPVITIDQFNEVKSNHPDIVSYPVDDASIKLPAAWLIDRAGWKGKTVGGAQCYEKQALVLINKGNATGRDIFTLSQNIIDDVKTKYGITLDREVNLIS